MKKTQNRATLFLKRNAVYLVLALCVLAVTLSVVLTFLTDSNTMPEVNAPIDNEQVQEPDVPVEDPIIPDEPEIPVDTVITFIMPVSSTVAIEEYSEIPVFNSTLSRYEVHKAIDFYTEEGANVFAVYGGTIEKVENTLLEGITVTIDHGNGLKTVYNSLADGDSVSVGQKVAQGDIIGQVSTTNRQEYKEGAHLHFEVFENGLVIDPVKYLTIDEK